MQSKPPAPIEPIWVGFDRSDIQDPFTERVTESFNWVSKTVSIGAAYINRAQIVYDSCYADLASRYAENNSELVSEKSFLELYLIGGDGRGEGFLFDPDTGQFYTLSHGLPEVLSIVAKNREEFIQWVIRERSWPLLECPWILCYAYSEDGADSASFFHPGQVPRREMELIAQNAFEWSRKYSATMGFAFYDEASGVGIRFVSPAMDCDHQLDVLIHSKSRTDPRFFELLTNLSNLGFRDDL